MEKKYEGYRLFDEVRHIDASFLGGESGKIVEIDRAKVITVQWGDNPMNKWCYPPGNNSLVVTNRKSAADLYRAVKSRTCSACPCPGNCATKRECLSEKATSGYTAIGANAVNTLADRVAQVMSVPLLPHDSDERKKYPLASAFLDYFPSAVAHLANHSFVANEKHNPGQPVHWSRDKSNDHRDAAMRHLLEGDWAGLAWRGMALLQLELESKGHPVAPGARYSTETAR